MIKFEPNWYSPPSDTIRDIMEENNYSKEQFAIDMNKPIDFINDLLDDKIVIDLKVATKLRKVLGSSSKFWMKRYSQYLEDLERWKKKQISLENIKNKSTDNQQVTK